MTNSEILTALLNKFEANGSNDVDAFLSKELEGKLSEDGMKKLLQVNEILDSYDEKAKSLAKAKSDGYSREQWLQMELAEIASRGDLSEDLKDNLVDSVKDIIINGVEVHVEKATKEEK